MSDINMVDIEGSLAEWLLKRYFVPYSPYNYSHVGLANKAYFHVNEAVDIEQIINHLLRSISIAAPSAHNGMAVKVSVDIDSLDIDMVTRAKKVLRNQHLPVIVSFSGNKGYHLSVFLIHPTPLIEVQQISRVIHVALTNEGIEYCKISPSPNGSGGDCMALPLGVHPETGNYCYFLDDKPERVDVPLSFIQTIPLHDLSCSNLSVEVDQVTGEVITTYPNTISQRPCINRLWNEGLQAPGTRHFATMVIANAVMRTTSIHTTEKEHAVLDWVNRIYEKSKANGFINSSTEFSSALSDAKSMLRHYKCYGTFAELCENQLFKKAMRSACLDEYRCRLEQNHGSANYRLMRRLGVFAATNASPKGLGKSAMAIYEAIEDIYQDYPVFDWNGHQAFTLSTQQLIPLAACSRATVINNRKKLINAGLLVSIPKADIPLDIIQNAPSFVGYYYLPKIDETLIKRVLKSMRDGHV